MTEHDSKLRSVNRREFLSLVGSGVAFAVTSGSLAKHAEAEVDRPAVASAASAAANALANPGPIAMEHFEAARKRASDLVARMTVEEKISQFGHKVPGIPRLNMPAFNYYASEALHGLIHEGPVTSFPLPLALGCSWNPDLIHRVFTAVSDEIWAWHKKNGQGLAMFSPPTVNMGTRDPRWGRIGENYSEDPLLVSKLAVEAVRGIQGDNPRYLKSVACAKHFAANDTEDDRTTTSASVDSRSFYEYYARGFEACVRQGGTFTVMSSYNEMNGIPTTANPFLLTELLRDRWGFQGYVVSDCDAVGDIMRTHHFVPTYAEASALAVNAGCDINCGSTLPRFLGEAVDKMLISEETIDRSLIRSITGRVLLGDFDPMEQNPYSNIPVSCLESPEHRELCREAGRQSVVLFKNENSTLPLHAKGIQKIAVIGPMAATCQLGNYSGKPLDRVSPLDGILSRFGIQAPASLTQTEQTNNQAPRGAKYTGPASLEFTGGTTHVSYAIGCTVTGEKDDTLMQAALEAAKGADAVLVFAGDDEQIDREGHDRDFLHLPGAQHDLIQAVYAANPKTILVISSNCPVSVLWEQENLPAIVGGIFLGGQQGDALADVIFGDYNPGGKVSMTWYRHTSDLPDFDSYNIRYGRTYLYYQGVPLYPFGHGLSYTAFDYSGLKVSADALKAGGSLSVQMQVRNSGKREGDEIVQFYVRVSGGTVQRPVKQLVGFERVHLAAGESRTVHFVLEHSDVALSYWNEDKQAFVVDPGTVDLMIGASSADIRLAHQAKLEA
ncbi:MAG TPA: glycoside hydrolase family 3 C-terminal domain-containing protein [Acidobacteriaceae bacterium]|nr:glycoside hydrolase family 3 C-terminal domain-containing protein [Acidobacteriaceae bacterium]